MKIIINYLLIISQLLNFGYSQDIDSVITIKESNFFETLLRTDGDVQYIVGSYNELAKPKTPILIPKPQILIKSKDELFLTFGGSGRLYKLKGKNDSTLLFKRLDSSENINYNIGAYYFTYKNQVYSFGGYGFWKNYGSLRFFNSKDRQWDIVPLNEEVIPQVHPIENSWYDPKKEKLFVSHQTIVNAGIKGTEYLKGKAVPFAYLLDLSTNEWTKLGKVSKELIEIMSNGQVNFRSKKGLLILYYDKVYLADFNSNKLYTSLNSNFNQSIARKTFNDFVYENNGYLYSLDRKTQNADSLLIDYGGFADTGILIWEPIYNYSISITIAIFIFFAVSIFLVFKKKKKHTSTINNAHNNYKIQFSDIEIALLKLLIDKKTKKLRADITEVNYVLGLKHKNTGLQKKVRSDTFSNINEKFRYISKTDDPLIQSIRSESDKRYFEYYIEDKNISIIQEYLV